MNGLFEKTVKRNRIDNVRLSSHSLLNQQYEVWQEDIQKWVGDFYSLSQAKSYEQSVNRTSDRGSQASDQPSLLGIC